MNNRQFITFHSPVKEKPPPKVKYSREEDIFFKVYGYRTKNKDLLERAMVEIKRFKRGQKI